MVTVYQFKRWDSAAGEMKTQPLKSRKDRIDLVGGEIIDGTAEDVPESALDREGRYQPSDGGVVGGASVGEASVAGGDDISGAFQRTPDGRTPIDPGLSSRGARGERAFEDGTFQPDAFLGGSMPAANAGVGTGEFKLNATAENGGNVAAEHARRRNAEFIARATSGANEPIGPAGTTLITEQEPTAGNTPSFLHSGVQDSSSSPQPSLASAAIIQESPADIEAMARKLAGEFDRERERARSNKSNVKPEDADAYCDFLERMSARLNELADAIHAAFTKPQAGEPIFTPKVQEALEAVGADFFDYLKTNREKVYTIGLYGGAAVFLSMLNAPAAGVFLTGLLLGKSSAPTTKK